MFALSAVLRTALRALRRRPGYAALNVVGLGVGLAACLLLALWVRDELAYDDFHAEAERTYRLALRYTLSADHAGTTFALTPDRLAGALRRDHPQVEAAVRVVRASHVVRRGARAFVEDDVYRADAAFFEAFSFPLQSGPPARVLAEPQSVVLTPEAARRYFPDTPNPVGQTLVVGEVPHEVTGVTAPPPGPSHMNFAMVTSLPRFERPSWFRNRVVTYVRLTPEADAAAVQASLTDLIRARKQSLDDPERDYALFLQPLTGIHLGQGLPPGIALADRRLAQTFGGTGRQAYVVLFGVLAVVVLLVACVNFMNLATARATERAAEVGVRRALGAQRRGLAMQFVAEAVLATGAGLALALALAALALPAFNAVAGKALRLDALWSSAPALAAVAAGVLATGLVAGSYPAVALSRFEPAAVLRGEAVRGVGGRRRRRALVVLQFAVSVALIVATVVTHGQLEHLREAPLGFDAEATVLLDLSRDLMGPSQPALPKQALADVPGAAHVALANGVPGQSYSFTRYRPLSPSGAPTGSPTSLYAAWGDYDYAEALGLEVVAGRSFSRAFPSDSSAMLLNESAARQLFGDADPIGRQVATTGRDARARTVVGVVKDFNYHALRRSVEPMAIFFLEFPQSWPTPETMLLRLEDTTDVPATLAAVKNRWTEALPEAPFAYAFLDDRLDAQYRSEARLARVFGAFAGLALFVACLGLVGLAAYAATRRRREIGLRKAVGASTAQLVALLSTDFLRPVALACALAVPVAYVALERWLASFASRVSVRPAWLLAACAAALALALAATALQAVRAARVDPARTLRSE